MRVPVHCGEREGRDDRRARPAMVFRLPSQETGLAAALVRGYRSIIHWAMNNEEAASARFS
jgi:hypothetical protein